MSIGRPTHPFECACRACREHRRESREEAREETPEAKKRKSEEALQARKERHAAMIAALDPDKTYLVRLYGQALWKYPKDIPLGARLAAGQERQPPPGTGDTKPYDAFGYAKRPSAASDPVWTKDAERPEGYERPPAPPDDDGWTKH